MPGEIAVTQKEIQEFMRLIAADLSGTLIEKNLIPTSIVRGKIERLKEFAAFYDYNKALTKNFMPSQETIVMNLSDDEIKVLMKKSANELLGKLTDGYRGDTKESVDRLVVLQANLAPYRSPNEEG